MAVGIGAAGIVGIAVEAVAGTYEVPDFYLPVRGESINFTNEVQYTRPIMGVADAVHAIEGPQSVEGDLDFEVLPDAIVYLMRAARATEVKAGAGPYTYTYTPTAAAVPTATASLTIVRNGVVFGYAGCAVGGMEFTVDSGVFVCTASVVGRSEATQSAPTPSWPTMEPAGADTYTITLVAAALTSVDNFTWSFDDSAEAVYRLGVAQAAAFVKYGERSVEASLDMDFEDKTEFANFKAVTAQRLQFDVDWDANNYVHLDTKLATMSTNEINLSSQGDLVRGSISYTGKYDFATSKAYELVVSSDTDIT